QRDALLSDARLTDTTRAAELVKLDLARKREQLQLRMTAAADKELEAAKKAKDLKNNAQSGAASLINAAFSGNLSGSQIGSTLASFGAKAIGGIAGGPIGMAVAEGIGGLVGGLFGRKKKSEEVQQPVIKGLDAIERAQKETVTAIQAQTDALLKPEN